MHPLSQVSPLPPPLCLPAARQRKQKQASSQEGDLCYLGGNKKDFDAGEHDFHLGFAVDLNYAVADLEDVQEDAETTKQQQ